VNALSRLSVCISHSSNELFQANYLREPVGVRQPPVNGLEIIEQREVVEIRISSLFRDTTDLSLAREIAEVCFPWFSS